MIEFCLFLQHVVLLYHVSGLLIGVDILCGKRWGLLLFCAELAQFASEKGIRKEAVTAFVKHRKVFANRAASGSGYDWHWNFKKKFKKRLNASHLTVVVAYFAAKVLRRVYSGEKN